MTITFADYGGKTKFTFQQTPFEKVEDRDSHVEGWSQSFDRLAAGPELRTALEVGRPVQEIWDSWEEQLTRFRVIRTKYLIY